MASLFKDPFTEWLISRQMKPRMYAPAAYLGAAPVGWRLSVGGSTFVYRIPQETPHIFIIVLFERQGERTGLRSPFADIVRFLALVRRSGADIHTVQGHVAALAKRPEDSLESEKISAFYTRYLAAHRFFMDNGVEWVAGDLRTCPLPLGAARDPFVEASALI